MFYLIVLSTESTKNIKLNQQRSAPQNVVDGDLQSPDKKHPKVIAGHRTDSILLPTQERKKKRERSQKLPIGNKATVYCMCVCTQVRIHRDICAGAITVWVSDVLYNNITQSAVLSFQIKV